MNALDQDQEMLYLDFSHSLDLVIVLSKAIRHKELLDTRTQILDTQNCGLICYGVPIAQY